MLINNKNKAFTLIEILIGILITSTVLVIWFYALSVVMAWKSKLIDSTNIAKETFFFTQRLFEEIKKWGLIDYEEYFNRSIIWTWNFSSWHYSVPTWFGNFWAWWTVWWTSYWAGFYYCRSWDIGAWWTQMWTGWCITTNNNNDWTFTWLEDDYSLEPQRYGQYSFQFIDYNSNYDDDLWDEDGDGNIIWDDDDEYVWEWPAWFVSWINVKELYLISWDKTRRTYFRWTVKEDPYATWSSLNCNFGTWEFPTWSGCLWTIEFLKLDWKDWWMDHSTWSTASWTLYDWVIDTWLINENFSGWWKIAWSDSYNWLPLFPDSINVSDFEVYVYPNKDVKQAWKDKSEETNTSPYVRIKLKLSPSWKTKKKIKWKVPEFELNTTINLTDIYSR